MEEVGARIQDLWNGILDFTSKLVIPDWGSLVALIPLLLLVLVVAYFLGTLAALTRLGPRRRGLRRIAPVNPPGVHAGTPSFAPILAALGTFLVFVGLVVKGWFIVAGIGVLVVTLLYWGREAIRDYEHLEPSATAGAAGTVALLGPPPGVHMPAPSFRPILASLAVALLFLGLIAGPWIAAAGVFALVVSLLGWLRDARREYAGLAVADSTGHPPVEAAPRYPVGTLAAIGIVLAVALVLNTGLLPPRGGGAGGGAAASGAPGSSGGAASPATSGGAASGGPGGSGGAASAAAGDVTIEAKAIAFVQQSVSAPAGRAFTIGFDNQDNGIPHNVDIQDSGGASVFKGEIVTGVTQKTYDVPALKAGTYKFVCDVHPNMTGTLTVQ